MCWEALPKTKRPLSKSICAPASLPEGAELASGIAFAPVFFIVPAVILPKFAVKADNSVTVMSAAVIVLESKILETMELEVIIDEVILFAAIAVEVILFAAI